MAARRALLRPFRIVCAVALGTAVLAACTSGDPPETVAGGALGSYVVPPGIHKIKHVIMIMMENRSFDEYFGTFPGAAGSPHAQFPRSQQPGTRRRASVVARKLTSGGSCRNR